MSKCPTCGWNVKSKDINEHGIGFECSQPEDKFVTELRGLINKYSKENGSDTADFVLAEYLDHCLRAFDYAVRYRESLTGPK